MYGSWQHTHIYGKYRTALPSPTMIRNGFDSKVRSFDCLQCEHVTAIIALSEAAISKSIMYTDIYSFRQILKLFTPSFPSIPIHNAGESREPVSIRLCFSSLALFAAFSGLKLLRFFSPFQLPSYFCMVLYFFLSFTFSIPCSCPQRLRFKQFKK